VIREDAAADAVTSFYKKWIKFPQKRVFVVCSCYNFYNYDIFQFIIFE